MESPVYAYLKRPSLVDFPGRLAAVFFTSGCNFQCAYCHNAKALGCRRPGLAWEALEAACHGFREQWVEGAVITGGEPTLWEELPRLVAILRGHGLAVKLDTNGSHPEVLEALLPELDYVAMDIKCALAHYPDMVACHHPVRIARSVELLMQGQVDYEFRTTILEGIHTQAEMAEILKLIQGSRRYVLQPFLPRPDLPDAALRNTPRTSSSHLRRVAAWMEPGIDNVIIRGD